MSDVTVVKIPTVAEATARRNSATPFEDPYVVPEGRTLACLPAFEADGTHVKIEIGGVRGRLLPICARAAVRAMTMYLLEKEAQGPIAKGQLQTGFAPEEEDLGEIGGFGFHAESVNDFFNLRSNDVARGVSMGPLADGDIQEICHRLRTAFAALPEGAVKASLVPMHLTREKPLKILRSWEHGEPADV